jgi:phenylacetic acid degradation operon negative regulatory protein
MRGPPPGIAYAVLVTSADQPPPPADAGFATPRPQSLMLTFFAVHILDTARAVSSGSVIDVFGRVGITEDAVRTTLTRMVNRGLLERHRRGRRMYFGLTPRAEEVLVDGRDRVWRTGAVNRDWDGSWTIVGFSLPEDWRSERHDLRSRLVWGGFGPLQNGMWTAPGRIDAAALVAGLGLEGHLKVFHARTAKPTEAAAVVETAFDLTGIAGRYHAFQARWERGEPAVEAADDLGRELLLHTDWLGLVRQDPHLPAEHLPADWPAEAAEQLFHDLARRYAQPAREIAAGILDTVEVDAADLSPAEPDTAPSGSDPGV